MADDHKINLQENSKYRVSLDLMYKISTAEDGDKDRKYWLKLYEQCRSVVSEGWTAEDALSRK